MANLALNIKFGVNEGAVMSPQELINNYLFGINMTNSTGGTMSDEDILFCIKAAQKEIERALDIRLQKQVIQERKSYYREELNEWGFLPTTYLVKKAISLKAYYADTLQISYPSEWLAYKKSNDGESYHRKMFLVPPGIMTGTAGNNPVYLGIMPQYNFMYQNNIPYYWEATYLTGFDKVPEDLINIIGKLASINIFHQLGDIILGAGIASQSISVDGLSQSISTTSSAENSGYSARVKGYLEDIKKNLIVLKGYYKDILFESC